MEKKVFYGMSVLGIVSIFALIGCGGGSSSSGISYNKQVLDIDF